MSDILNDMRTLTSIMEQKNLNEKIRILYPLLKQQYHQSISISRLYPNIVNKNLYLFEQLFTQIMQETGYFSLKYLTKTGQGHNFFNMKYRKEMVSGFEKVLDEKQIYTYFDKDVDVFKLFIETDEYIKNIDDFKKNNPNIIITESWYEPDNKLYHIKVVDEFFGFRRQKFQFDFFLYKMMYDERYKKVKEILEQGMLSDDMNMKEYFQQLKDSGYQTDPKYVDKLINIYKVVRQSVMFSYETLTKILQKEFLGFKEKDVDGIIGKYTQKQLLEKIKESEEFYGL